MLKIINSVPLPIFLVLSLFLGLAPFFPEPHLFEKLHMLAAGEAFAWLDMLDLTLHLTPWLLLLLKVSLILHQRVRAFASG